MRVMGFLGRFSSILLRSWGRQGRVLGVSWRDPRGVPDASWRHLGVSSRRLGASWVRSGASRPEVVLSRFGAIWVGLGRALVCLGGTLGHPKGGRANLQIRKWVVRRGESLDFTSRASLLECFGPGLDRFVDAK